MLRIQSRGYRYLMLALVALLLAGCAAEASSPPSPLTIRLNPQDQQGIGATAELIARGSRTEIIINEPTEPGGASQPASIHQVSCENLNPSGQYALQNVQQGQSTTVIDVPLNRLMDGQHAINLNASVGNLDDDVGCGDIPRQ
jgi:hypothetical protein